LRPSSQASESSCSLLSLFALDCKAKGSALSSPVLTMTCQQVLPQCTNGCAHAIGVYPRVTGITSSTTVCKSLFQGEKNYYLQAKLTPSGIIFIIILKEGVNIGSKVSLSIACRSRGLPNGTQLPMTGRGGKRVHRWIDRRSMRNRVNRWL
jgi:hypothetical protein